MSICRNLSETLKRMNECYSKIRENESEPKNNKPENFSNGGNKT